MSKRNVVILVLAVFVLSGFFYKAILKSENISSPSGTGSSANTAGGSVTPTGTSVKPSVSVDSNNILDLSGQGLDKLPSYVTDRTGLEELNISNNRITGALPSQIQRLAKLKILNASDNLMTGVPAEVGQLSNLEVLDLSNNQLTGLPNELGNLKKLKVLNLSGNNYSTQDLEIIKKGLPSTVQIIL